MARIFLVRHGEVEGNYGPNRTFAGWGDKPLTDKGRRQAQAVGARLAQENLVAVYSSDLSRARHTAEAIAAPHNLVVQCDTALREVNYGKWEGLGDGELLRDWADLWQKRIADPLNVAPPDGESYADLWRRLRPAWEAIGERHPDQSVAVVGHNGSLRILLCHLLGAPLGNARHIRLMNTGVSCIEYEDSAMESGAARFVVSSMNDTCHLAGI